MSSAKIIREYTNPILRDSYELGIGNIAGIGVVWVDPYFYVVDSVDASVYVYDSDFGTEITEYDIGALGDNDFPYGIAWDGTYFYITDLDDDTVYKYPSDFSTLTTSYNVGALGGNDTPYGIVWDGNYFYITDVDDFVYKYPSDFSILSASYNIGALGDNDDATGITWDGTYFYLVDNTDAVVYRYPSDFSAESASYDIGALGGNDSPLGIAWDENFYYIIDNVDTNIYKYSFSQYEITSDTIDFKITTEIGKIPKATARIKSKIFAEDDIIQVTDTYSSWQKGRGLYKDSMDFRDDMIGSVPAQTGEGIWTDNSEASCSAIIIDKYNKHRYVLQLYDGATADKHAILDLALTDDTVTDGSIEFWIATTDPTKESIIYIYDEDAAITAGIKIDADLWYFYRDSGGAAWEAFGGGPTAPVVGKWYRCTITFDTSDQSLTYIIVDEDDVAIASDDDDTHDLLSTSAFIEDIRFVTDISVATDINYITFIDSIGFTWDTSYTLGDNANYEVTLASQTIFEGQITKQTREAIQKFSLISKTQELKQPVGEEADVFTVTADYSPNMISQLLGEYNHATATEQDEIFRGLYNFLNDTDEAAPMGWVCITATNTVETDSTGNHKNILEIARTGGTYQTYNYFESQTSGTVEVYLRAAQNNAHINALLIETGANLNIQMAFRDTGQISLYYGAAWNDVVAYAANTWYHIRVDFECGAGGYLGLAADTMNLYVDGILEASGVAFRTAATSLDHYAVYISVNGTIYLDALSYSWDWRYPECRDYSIGTGTDTATYTNKQILVDEIEPSGIGAIASANIVAAGDVNAAKVIKDFADKELMIWYLNPSDEINMNDGTNDSQIDFSSSDKIWAVKGSDRIQRINKVVVKGGQIGGDRKYATADNLDSQTTYGVKLLTVFITEVVDDTDDLQAIADNILEKHENAPDQVILWRDCSTEGMMQIGETIIISANDIEYSRNSDFIAAGQWIIRKIIYEPLTQVARFWLIDSLIYEPDEQTLELIEKIINQGLA